MRTLSAIIAFAPPGPRRLASIVSKCMTSKARVFMWNDNRSGFRDYKIGKLHASWYKLVIRHVQATFTMHRATGRQRKPPTSGCLRSGPIMSLPVTISRTCWPGAVVVRRPLPNLTRDWPIWVITIPCGNTSSTPAPKSSTAALQRVCLMRPARPSWQRPVLQSSRRLRRGIQRQGAEPGNAQITMTVWFPGDDFCRQCLF